MTNRRELADRLEQDAIGDLRHCIAIASQEQPDWRSTWEEALTVITAPDPLLEEAVGLLRRLGLSEADAKSNPMGGLSIGGLMDCRDNNGCVYQSADLADILARSATLISRLDAERKGGG